MDFEGLIFIGLFEQMIPQSRPIAGTMLTRGGAFCLDALPKAGNYYLLFCRFASRQRRSGISAARFFQTSGWGLRNSIAYSNYS